MALLTVLSIVCARIANAQQPNVSYVYDDVGRLRQVRSDGQVRTYVYDPVGNLLRIERGDGACSPTAPVIDTIEPASCLAGTSCRIVLGGSGLLGAVVRSADADVVITDCGTDCDRIACLVSPAPTHAPGTTALTVSNPQGMVDVGFEVLPPPALGGPGQADLWHFAASRGDVVTIAMTRIADQDDGSSRLDPRIEVRDSRGILLTFDDDGGTTVPPGPGKNALVRSFVLPATDVYEVTARGAGGTFGPYLLEIDPPTIPLRRGPRPSPGSETPAFEFEGVVAAPGARGLHDFSADRGAVATIEVSRIASEDGTATLDPALELRDSRGVLLRADDDGGGADPPGPGRNPIIKNLSLPATDTYRIVVFGSGATTGPYEVRVFLRD